MSFRSKRGADRTAAELIREAMEAYRRRWAERGGSVLDFAALGLSAVKKPLNEEDDLLGEMLE